LLLEGAEVGGELQGLRDTQQATVFVHLQRLAAHFGHFHALLEFSEILRVLALSIK